MLPFHSPLKGDGETVVENGDMILVKVDQLLLSNVGFAVLLKGVNDKRTLPIIIGGAESQAIALCINNVNVPRPLTHDLLKNILDFMECRLLKVEISDLKEGTFYAKLILDRDGHVMEMDARPSDSVALALRSNAPIYVAGKVMEEAGRIFAEQNKSGKPASGLEENTVAGPPKKAGKTLTPIEALQRDLDAAVTEERYEDAATLRDEIDRIKKSTTGN